MIYHTFLFCDKWEDRWMDGQMGWDVWYRQVSWVELAGGCNGWDGQLSGMEWGGLDGWLHGWMGELRCVGWLGSWQVWDAWTTGMGVICGSLEWVGWTNGWLLDGWLGGRLVDFDLLLVIWLYIYSQFLRRKTEINSWKAFSIYCSYMRFVQMKLVQRLFWVKEYRPFKVVPMSTETGNPLTHHLRTPPERIPSAAAGTTAPLWSLMSLSDPSLWSISTFFL